MQFTGTELLTILRGTTTMIKLLELDGQLRGHLTAAQVIVLVQSDPERFKGGGSQHRIRYIQFVAKRMTPAQLAFAKAHDLPAYDPTYFRNFSGYPSRPSSRRRSVRHH